MFVLHTKKGKKTKKNTVMSILLGNNSINFEIQRDIGKLKCISNLDAKDNKEVITSGKPNTKK